MPENITDVSQWEANIQFPTDGDGANGSVHEPIWQKIGNRTRWLKDQVDATVRLTGNQNIAGVKTFTASPIVPTPTTDMQAATKKYVDDNLGIAGAGAPGGAHIGNSASGYVKHRNGLMEHWQVGSWENTEGDYVYTLPVMPVILSVQVTTQVVGGAANADYWYQVVTWNPDPVNNLTLRLQCSTGTPSGDARPLIRVLGTY